MRPGMYALTGIIVFGLLVTYIPVNIAPMPISIHDDMVYSCATVEELYNASNLIVRGKPSNIRMYYRNDPDEVYDIEVSEIYKGQCDSDVKVILYGISHNKHPPILSEKELAESEVILFLYQNSYNCYVVDSVRGFFVINEGMVYSIGEIDKDCSTITNNIHGQGSLYDFERSYMMEEQA